MFYLVGNLTVADADEFIEGAKSWAQDHGDEWGMVESTHYRGVDKNIVIIINAYKTLEEAQKHKADIEAPHMQAGHEQMGVKSFATWITERRVAL